MTELRIEGVGVRYGRVHVVRDVHLIIPAGTVLGLVGESGSGKSSLARGIVGLAPLSAGSIRMNGRDVGRKPSRSGLQMVFQDPYASLDPRMSAGASIAEAVPKGTTRAARDARVAELLGLVGLDPAIAPSRPGKLSGGQRQRVAVARALATEPSYLIADEITSALDVSVQGAILNLIRELQTNLGLGVLFISHNIAVVRYVSDAVAVMRGGEIVENGPVEAVLASPVHPYTQELLAAARAGVLAPGTSEPSATISQTASGTQHGRASGKTSTS
ncbi:ABC transporter ATP-binding protein [Streptomyces sp. NPDC088816]|uniref:ABC transporter ATP-binding protein n=1 Tax=unclassified Streptomyces TaxID=2593676 RepID=UPI0037FDCB6E